MTHIAYDKDLLKSLLAQECSLVLGDALMDRLLDGGDVICYKRNGLISAVGDVDPDIYIVIEGIVRSWYDEGNREVTKSFAMPGTVIVSYHSFYFDKPQFYNISAATPAKCLRIPRAHYNALVDESHEFARWALSMAQSALLLRI